MFPRIVFTGILLMILAGLGYGVTRLVISRQPLPQATALLEQHDPRGAQLVLRPLVRAEPRNAEAHVLLARTHLDLHDAVAAEKELKIARALRYERMVVTPLLARSYLMQGRYQDLLADVPANAASPEERVTNLALRATAYLLMGDMAQAQSTLDTAAEAAPADPKVQVVRARMALARGETAAAATAIDSALASTPKDLDSLLLKAEIQVQAEQLDRARETLDAAVALEPYSMPARLQRAWLLMSLNQDAKAREDVNASLEVDPHDVPLRLADSLLNMRAGRVGDSATALQRLLSTFDQNPRGFYYLALAFSLQDQNESSYEMLGRFLRVRPRDAEGMRLQGLLEQRLGRAPASIEVLQQVVRLRPKDALAHDLLGRGYFMTGAMQEAVDAYRRATVLDPGNKEYAAHLAAAQVRFGEPASARASAAPDAAPSEVR